MNSHKNISTFTYSQPSNLTYFQLEKVEKQPKIDPSSIYIVGTGGTIVGTAATSTSANYDPSKLEIAAVIDKIPELKEFNENILTLDLFRVNSEDITTQHWLKLAKEVNKLLQDANVKGVVITHGTDTIEETAYFLDLVIKSDKPVVLVGSMRSSTSMSADGPLNLFNAISVVHAPDSPGKGVMVMLNDTIYDGRDVTKCNTTQVNTFNSPNSGPIGHVHYGKVTFEKKVIRKHTTETPFDVMELDDLPSVEIIYEHAGSTGTMFKAAIEANPQGIVFAGTGDGNLHARDRALLNYAKEKGIQIVRSSRTGCGRVTDANEPKSDQTLIGADNLNAQKARILLMLSLTQTQQVNDIQNNFKLY